MRTILLNPGPVSISDGVRRALASADLCHREPEFFDLQERIRSQLLRVYGLAPNDWTAVLLGGSGTTALEAMITTLVPRDGRLLVLENGVYGERLHRLAEIHGIECRALRHSWTDPWNLPGVEEELATGSYTHVAAVHHETTTGRLNPLPELLALCERRGARLLLDAVSSFGAEQIPFESLAVAACAATANKCLHGVPGSCFVLTRRSALTAPAVPPRSLTLDLALWDDHQQRRSTPFTPAVHSLLALDMALSELEQAGGWPARHARYTLLADRVGSELASLGVVSLLPGGESSCVLRAYRLPFGRSYEQVHDSLKQRGFVIYSGQGRLASEMFRLSTMGDINDDDVERLLLALSAALG